MNITTGFQAACAEKATELKQQVAARMQDIEHQLTEIQLRFESVIGNLPLYLELVDLETSLRSEREDLWPLTK